ncbi:Cytochrome c oxidase polypeptide II [hydrothermal vent metagenome]|uniref:Cytochrome c oxidase polypeptide II n=1 Tax=hydrothermal vent metagenome TaxID=652676 RepID=A0A1W1BCC3_9ZZZZ
MTFSNSLELLAFHETAYTIYALLIISVVAWFGYNLRKEEKAKSIVRIPFYTYMAFLVAGGVGHHIFTYNAIPWVSEDMTRHNITPDASYEFEIKDHKWLNLPKKITVQCDQTIEFNVKSHDLVYGFGLFRQDGTLVTQMQVNPGTDVNGILDSNDMLWTFHHNGVFNLTSTEYSGTAQYNEEGEDLMEVKNFVEVVGCNNGGAK